MLSKTPFSVVIIARNESEKILTLLESLRGLTDNIVVCDTGSTDGTQQIAKSNSADVYQIPWEGFGKSRNKAIEYAKYDWVLNLDADEKIDPILYEALKMWEPTDGQSVYQVRWKNFIGNYHAKQFDSWKCRLFSRNAVSWDNTIAHEEIVSEKKINKHHLPGCLEHYSHDNFKDLFNKYWYSAMLTAEKYHTQGKKSLIINIVFSPMIAFLRSYFFKLGFLEGIRGVMVAGATSYYTFIKYVRLYELGKKRDLK